MPRKEHEYHYIYKVICNINKKYYIGMHSTSNLEDGYFGSGKVLKRSLNKHGKENHVIEILEWLPDRSSLKVREREIVNESLLSNPMCMNLMIGGEGGKISDAQQKERSVFGGKGFSRKLKEDLTFLEKFKHQVSNRLKEVHKSGKIKYDTFTGKSHSEDIKSKIGKANSTHQLGEGNSQFGTCWITNGIENKKIKKTDILPVGWKLGRKIG
jgi:hypothetical protein